MDMCKLGQINNYKELPAEMRTPWQRINLHCANGCINTEVMQMEWNGSYEMSLNKFYQAIAIYICIHVAG